MPALAQRSCTNPPTGRQRPITFICADCGLEEVRPTPALPKGWDLIPPRKRGGNPTIRCPDCAEMVEQAHFARHRATAPAHAGESGNRDRVTWSQVQILPDHPSFMTSLEKQADGRYLVALTPEGVLMRWMPLGFFLEPGQARTLAAELVKLADLADAPGTLGGGK